MSPKAARLIGSLLVAAGVLLGAAALRDPEYDEGYTRFLTAGDRVPAWPMRVFTAGEVRAAYRGRAEPGMVAARLAASDVHPPLYFWAVSAWRGVVGPSLFGIRALSVVCALAGLGLVTLIAAEARAPPALAVLLTAGCYGFAYTGALARGFAFAELFGLAGLWCALRRLPAVAGLCVGLATGANFLAGFGLAPVLVAAGRGGLARALAGFGAVLPLPLAFYLAQRDGREGQFGDFDFGEAARRLARDQLGAVFGGLPLYAGRLGPAVGAALAMLAMLLVVRVWRRRRDMRHAGVLAAGAASPAAGLIALSWLTGTLPIELRYFAFGLPCLGVLLAGALARSWWRWPLLAVQAVSITGLLTRPETMQPQAEAARLAAEAGGLALLPRGNDGVGIPGAFIAAAPDGQRILLVRPMDTPDLLRAEVAGETRVTLVLLGMDAASRATLPVMCAAVEGPCWRPAATGATTLAVHDNACAGTPDAIHHQADRQ